MHVDIRSPWVISTHDLSRQPGAMRPLELSAPAPADLGIALLGVPEGSPVRLDLRLEAVMEGILVSGVAQVSLTGECARCLEPLEQELEAPLQELFAYPENDIGDDSAGQLDGEYLDLEPVLRDAVVTALPFQPVCREDCPGLCTECGARLADDPDHAHPDQVDPRWAALADLQARDEEE